MSLTRSLPSSERLSRPARADGVRGYTVVEVVLVAAMMVLIAGLVFAALGPAREATRQRVCASNLRQIGQAIRLYVDDYQGQEPMVGAAMGPAELGLPATGAATAALLSAYVKNRKLLFCPSYHGKLAASRMLCSYEWCTHDERFVPKPFRFSTLVEKRGPDAVVLDCREHNASWDGNEARWTLKRVIVLRLSGEVQNRLVPVHSNYRTW